MKFIIPAGESRSIPQDMPGRFQHYWQSYDNDSFSHPSVERCYSLVNYPLETDELVFHVRWYPATDEHKAGVGAAYLGSMRVGQQVRVTGPFSEFGALDNSRRHVFIGAGSGLAPLRAILVELLKQSTGWDDVRLLYGARNQDHLVYHDDFIALTKQYNDFHYLPTLSQPSDSWQGKRGHVQAVLSNLFDQNLDLSATTFYLCGPDQMMMETEAWLIDKGVVNEQIVKESFDR